MTEPQKDTSFYNWPNFYKDEKKLNAEILCGILEDFFIIKDWFNTFNDFINHDNPEKDNISRVEEKLHGIDFIFKIGKIEKQEHQDILEELIYKSALNSNNLSSPVERANHTCNLIKEKILELKKDL
ncbi:hypothetical protein N9H57_05525 [Flavobacteriaceae bacterium]|nr:hypothetical protein [Flavobacteriaceae bacterium]MDA8948582.1 hypothetical protein [Flavobacteriaceae bacterium]MDA9015484.1 hypothetical protein [Flavobacteriaceae bacterium]MDA9571837.1 hypothetical protein [Flavobacteriaceae bacterium]MDB3862468.1 hypothetical protein [Flavobacteriaceae bacterium]